MYTCNFHFRGRYLISEVGIFLARSSSYCASRRGRKDKTKINENPAHHRRPSLLPDTRPGKKRNLSSDKNSCTCRQTRLAWQNKSQRPRLSFEEEKTLSGWNIAFGDITNFILQSCYRADRLIHFADLFTTQRFMQNTLIIVRGRYRGSYPR